MRLLGVGKLVFDFSVQLLIKRESKIKAGRTQSLYFALLKVEVLADNVSLHDSHFLSQSKTQSSVFLVKLEVFVKKLS